MLFSTIFMTYVAANFNINLIGSFLSSEDTAPANVFTFISLLSIQRNTFVHGYQGASRMGTIQNCPLMYLRTTLRYSEGG